jgi:hypothetical protein
VTPEKLVRLAALQDLERNGMLLDHEPGELRDLRRELAASPELRDDPSTPFTDESSRPQLDGSNYNDTLHRMMCDEFEGIARSFLTLLGRAAFDAAVAAVLKGR